MPSWMPEALRVGGTIGVIGGLWCFAMWWDRDEQQQSRIGIDAEQWKKGKAQVRARMRRPEWEKRLMAYWRRGNQILNSEAKR